MSKDLKCPRCGADWVFSTSGNERSYQCGSTTNWQSPMCKEKETVKRLHSEIRRYRQTLIRLSTPKEGDTVEKINKIAKTSLRIGVS